MMQNVLYNSDLYFRYKGTKYWINRCTFTLDGKGNKIFELYLDRVLDEKERTEEVIYENTGSSPQEFIQTFMLDKIVDGKTLYEIEAEMIVSTE